MLAKLSDDLHIRELEAEMTHRARQQQWSRETEAAKRWHAVHCVRESDEHVRLWLGPKHFNFETYYPMVRELRPVPMRKLSQKERRLPFKVMRATLVPFFPRYIFVRFDVGNALWRDAFNFAGVGGMLCHGNMPAPLDDWVIEQLMARQIDGAVPGALAMKDVFTPRLGEAVKITEGPFAQFNGVVEKLPATPIDGLDPDLVQRLQVARRELALESALAKLDKYHLLILDDIAYISKDQAETSACSS
jgi:transcription antitermination factor NusG